MKNLQNIIGGERNFLFSDKKNFFGEENFFGAKNIFLMQTEDYNLNNLVETKEETAEKLKLEKQKEELVHGKEIFGKDSEKTENIIDNNFNNLKELKNSYKTDLDVGDQFFDFSNIIDEKIDNFVLDTKFKLKVLDQTTLENYDKTVKKLIKLEDARDRVKNLKERKVRALESEKEFLNYVKSQRGFFTKMGDKIGSAAKTAGKVGLGVGTLGGSFVAEKVYDKYWSEDGKTERDIKQAEELEGRFDRKIASVENQKQKIEDFINQKKQGRDVVEGHIGGMLDGIGFNNEERNNFIKKLKESNSKDLIKEIDAKKDVNKETKKILIQAINLFNKEDKKEFNDFEKTQNVILNKEVFLEKIKFEKDNNETLGEINEKIEKDGIKEVSFKNKKLNGKEFGGEYKGEKIELKDGIEKFLFIEKPDKNNKVEWNDLSSVIIFDKEKGFVEVDNNFLEKIKDRELKNIILDKLREVYKSYEDTFEDFMYGNKDNKERDDFLNRFKILEKIQTEKNILEDKKLFSEDKKRIYDKISDINDSNSKNIKNIYKEFLGKYKGTKENLNHFEGKIDSYLKDPNSKTFSRIKNMIK